MAVTNPQFWQVVRDSAHPCHTAEAEAHRQAVFEKIKPAGNWKMPIDAVIELDDFDDCNEAAMWFTNGELQRERDWTGATTIRVTSPGYYVNVGA